VLVLVGLFAKLSAAPFHYWTPDAYAGAPASSVAFVSTVPKVAGTVALVELVSALAPGVPGAQTVLIVAAVLSMLVGNFAAYPQTDLRRLMAYSGVAHTGYILAALSAGEAGSAPAVFYAMAYAVPSMALVLMAAEEGTALDDLGGLAGRRPALAWAAVAWLVSLVGIPPLVGFFGKLYAFTAVIGADLAWLAIVAVMMSVVSGGYYFRVLAALFFTERMDATAATHSRAAALAFGLALVAVVGLGIFSAPVLEFLGVTL